MLGLIRVSCLIKLSELKINECAVIERINIFNSMRRRLQDLGIVNGTKIRCVLINPSGSISAYCVRGAVIALRKTDAEKICVRRLKGGNL